MNAKRFFILKKNTFREINQFINEYPFQVENLDGVGLECGISGFYSVQGGN